jgi:hypothetical protein
MQMPALHRYKPQYERRSSRTPSTFAHSRAVSTTFNSLFRIVCGSLRCPHPCICQATQRQRDGDCLNSGHCAETSYGNWRQPFQYLLTVVTRAASCRQRQYARSPSGLTPRASVLFAQRKPFQPVAAQAMGHFHMTRKCRILPLPAV